MSASGKVDIAVIANEPTPYRLHVLRRLAGELTHVKLHSIFTHSTRDLSVPWQLQLPPEINAVTFEGATLEPGRPIAHTAKLYRRVTQYLTANQVRLVILNGYNDLFRARLIRWACRAKVPLLVSGDSNIHGETHLSQWKRRLKTRYLRWVGRHVAGFMPMGRCGQTFFEHYAGADVPQILFPYEPDYAALREVDTAAVAEFRARHGLLAANRHLLYCGRLVDVKRVDVLIDAFARIAGDRSRWHLVIVGDGPLREALQQRVPTDLRDRVHWLGFQQFNVVSMCYRACDVLVLPSSFEPWAVVINEAVASGLAVVSTDVVGAAAELVRDGVNGCLVKPGSVGAMVGGLMRATDDASLPAMRRASSRVLEDWRRSADPVRGVDQAIRRFVQ
jgi:glycosyltransferase involved in cell wall biosynthesis